MSWATAWRKCLDWHVYLMLQAQLSGQACQGRPDQKLAGDQHSDRRHDVKHGSRAFVASFGCLPWDHQSAGMVFGIACLLHLPVQAVCTCSCLSTMHLRHCFSISYWLPMLVLHARAEPGCGGQVAVMSPGMYELSDYSLSWASANPGRQADGLYNGRPFLLQVNM